MICFIGDPETSPVLEGVRNYVLNGIPEDSWFRDCMTEPGKEMPKKVWYDYDGHTGNHSYGDFRNADVLYAARFRDGLVADHDIFPSFHNALNTIWPIAYKEKSTIVFRHIYKKYCDSVNSQPCPLTSHKGLENGFCDSIEYDLKLMNYHIDAVEGQQSQTYMRFKIFMLLEDFIQKLPTDPYNTTKVSPATNCKYIHALAVVLYTLVRNEDWISTKVYGADDFLSYFDATKRIHSTMHRLVRDNVFDDKDLYKTFVRFNEMIKSIDAFNDQFEEMFQEEGCKQTRFFSKKSLTKYDAYEKELCAKYGVWPTDEDKKRDAEEDDEEYERVDQSNDHDDDDDDDVKEKDKEKGAVNGTDGNDDKDVSDKVLAKTPLVSVTTVQSTSSEPTTSDKYAVVTNPSPSPNPIAIATGSETTTKPVKSTKRSSSSSSDKPAAKRSKK